MEFKLALADEPIAGHHDANFVAEFLNCLGKRAGDVGETAGLGKGVYFTRDEENVDGFGHSKLANETNLAKNRLNRNRKNFRRSSREEKEMLCSSMSF